MLILALAASVLLLGLLSKQMAQGKDPVLAQKAERTIVRKQVVIKRITEPGQAIYETAPSSQTPVVSSAS